MEKHKKLEEKTNKKATMKNESKLVLKQHGKQS
jgi:hypothetical protein